jgi:hypothetical protein
MPRRSAYLTLLLSWFISCDMKHPSPIEPPVKQEPVTQPASTRAVRPDVARIAAQIPSSASFVAAALRPEESLSRLKLLLQKPGLGGAVGEELLTDVLGLDLSKPGALASIGVDTSQALAFVIDGALQYENCFSDSSAAAVLIEPLPLSYLVIPLSDPKAFDAWVRAALRRAWPPLRFEEERLAGLSVSYARGDIEWPSALLPSGLSVSPYNRLSAAMVRKGDYLYFFFTRLGDPKSAAVPDPIAAFKATLSEFFTRPAAPLSEDATLMELRRQVGEEDLFLYASVTGFAKQHEQAGADRVVYSSPGGEAERRLQEALKERLKDVPLRHTEHTEGMLRAGEIVTHVAASAALEESRLRLKMKARIGGAWQLRLEKTFSQAAPSYLGYFPETMSSFVKLSLSPIGLRDLIFALSPAQEPAWGALSAQLMASTGLDLERELLGAVTGSAIVEIPTPIAMLRKNVAAFQLTTPEAGDKFLTTIARLLAPTGIISTEPMGDLLIYNLGSGKDASSWVRVDDLILCAFDPAVLKAALARRNAGTSFANNLSSPLARELATTAGQSGLALHVNEVLLFTSLAVPDPTMRAVLGRWGRALGLFVLALRYQEGGVEVLTEVGLQ